MVEIKTAREIDAIGAAGRVVADILAAARAVAAPGVTLKELDATAREILAKAGATSPFLNYHPKFAPVAYPAVICTSVNDAALHGIPGDYRLRDGDLLSVDAGATLDGWVGDAAISFTVGTPANGDAELIAVRDTARVDEGLLVEALGDDDERVALPMAEGIAGVIGIGDELLVLRHRAVHGNRPEDVVLLVHDGDEAHQVVH